jgi:cell division protein FtsL
MARTKKLTTAQKIEKIKAEIESLEIQIDAKTSELKDLELELRNEQAAELADAIAKSGKSLDEVMEFLNK